MRKWSQWVLLCADLVIPIHGQGHLKWDKIVKSVALLSMAGMEKWVESMGIPCNVKIVAMQDRHDRQTWHITQILMLLIRIRNILKNYTCDSDGLYGICVSSVDSLFLRMGSVYSDVSRLSVECPRLVVLHNIMWYQNRSVRVWASLSYEYGQSC